MMCLNIRRFCMDCKGLWIMKVWKSLKKKNLFGGRLEILTFWWVLLWNLIGFSREITKLKIKIKNGMHLGSYQKFRLFRDPKRFLDIYFSKLQQNISTYKPKTVLRLISDFTVRFRYESRFFSFEVFNRMLMANWTWNILISLCDCFSRKKKKKKVFFIFIVSIFLKKNLQLLTLVNALILTSLTSQQNRFKNSTSPQSALDPIQKKFINY